MLEMLMLYLDAGRKIAIVVGWVLLAWLAVSIPTALVLGRVIAQADADAPVLCEDDDEDDGTMWRDVPDHVRDRWHREADNQMETS